MQIFNYYFLKQKKDFKGRETAKCCTEFVPTAAKHVGDNMLPMVIKVESNYAVAKRNRD